MGGGKTGKGHVKLCNIGCYRKFTAAEERIYLSFYFPIQQREMWLGLWQFRKNILGLINHCNNFQFAQEESTCM